MLARDVCAGTLVTCCALMMTSSALGQNKNQPNRKHDEAEIRAARNKLEEAKREETEAHASLQSARRQVEKVRGNLISLRRKIEDQADGSAAIKRAQEHVDRAKAKLQPLLAPILAKVHESPEYTAAAKDRDALRERLKNLPEEEPPVQRPMLARQLVDAEGALRKLEQAAIEAQPAAREAKAELTAAEEKLRSLLAAADDVLLKHPLYAAAKRELDQAENQVDSAQAKLANKQRAVAAAQNKVQAEIAEERREDQRQRQQKKNKKN